MINLTNLDACSIVFSLFSSITIIVLITALYQKHQNQKRWIKEILKLDDIAKHYVLLAIKQPRIEVHEQDGKHAVWIAHLVADGWLDRFNDGVLTSGFKAEYLGEKTGELWKLKK